jgi:hypothetical protein
MPETMKFLHQCLFSPTVDTLCKAIDNNQLIGFPHLTSARVRKYLPESTATAKGHMNRQRKGVRSTTRKTKEDLIEDTRKAKKEMEEKEADMSPPQEEKLKSKYLLVQPSAIKMMEPSTPTKQVQCPSLRFTENDTNSLHTNIVRMPFLSEH